MQDKEIWRILLVFFPNSSWIEKMQWLCNHVKFGSNFYLIEMYMYDPRFLLSYLLNVSGHNLSCRKMTNEMNPYKSIIFAVRFTFPSWYFSICECFIKTSYFCYRQKECSHNGTKNMEFHSGEIPSPTKENQHHS